jgi:hypothetical protein
MGRPKGSLNKTTQAAREVIAIAAEGLGGVDRLVEWAKEDPANERAFWSRIYTRLLPLEVGGNLNSQVLIQVITGVPRDGDGCVPVTVVPKHRIEDGINAVRRILPRC